MFFLAVNIIKKNCVIGKQGFSLFPFFVLGIVPIFANDNYTLTQQKSSKNRNQNSNNSKPKDPNLPAPPKLQSFPTLGITSI
jgi:hypothetical protein